ncbi:unnamed protein product [Peniophora sp. CBMAI 1063]|nr:unnamed protein product [Peniophora sp. CBMAI 1063]
MNSVNFGVAWRRRWQAIYHHRVHPSRSQQRGLFSLSSEAGKSARRSTVNFILAYLRDGTYKLPGLVLGSQSGLPFLGASSRGHDQRWAPDHILAADYHHYGYRAWPIPSANLISSPPAGGTHMAPDHLSLVQKLPNDVLCELYEVCATYDPPMSDHPGIVMSTEHLAQLAPTWSTQLSKPVLQNDKYNQSSYATVNGWLPSHKLALGWLSLTHVCAHWRAVGLSLARLWGDVLPMLPHVVEETLARSRDGPVSLDMDAACRAFGRLREAPSSLRVSVFLHVAQQQIERAHTITFPLVLKDSWRPSLLRGAQLPYLKTLRIDPADKDELRDLASYTPALTHLSLRGTFASSVITSSLRCIKITNLIISRDVGSLHDTMLLQSLRSTPMLEELVLGMRYIFDMEVPMFAFMPNPLTPTSSDPILSIASAITLPKLSSAQFSAPSRALVEIVRFLDMPVDTELSLVAQPQDQDDDPDEPILPLLDAIAARLRDPSIDHMSVDPALDADAYYVCFASSPMSDGEPTPRLLVRAPVNAGIKREFGSLANYISRYVARMDPANITTFHGGSYSPLEQPGDPEESVSEYATLLRQLSNLTTLSVSCLPGHWHDQAFIGVLESCFVPETLETFTVYHTEESAAGNEILGLRFFAPGWIQLDETESRQRWKDIVSILSRRANSGKRLKRLILKGARGNGAPIKEIDARALREAAMLVEEVIDDRTFG